MSFMPKFVAHDVTVLIADGGDNETIDRVGLPVDGRVPVFYEYSVMVGIADLRKEGDRVVADVYLGDPAAEDMPFGVPETQPHFCAQLYPHLTAEASDFWEGDRVVAVGEGAEADIMLAEMPRDKLINFDALTFTKTEPADPRIIALPAGDLRPLFLEG